MLCLNYNLHREYGQHYHQPLPLAYIRHSLSFVLASWPPTYESDRQTDISTFLIRGASYTLIPKPYLENAQVITLLDNAAKQQQCSTASSARPTGKSEFLLDEPRASTQLGLSSIMQTHAVSMHLCSAAWLYWIY